MIPKAEASFRDTGIPVIVASAPDSGRVHHVPEIHTIKLVTRENENMLNPIFFQMHQILADGISRT